MILRIKLRMGWYSKIVGVIDFKVIVRICYFDLFCLVYVCKCFFDLFDEYFCYIIKKKIVNMLRLMWWNEEIFVFWLVWSGYYWIKIVKLL